MIKIIGGAAPAAWKTPEKNPIKNKQTVIPTPPIKTNFFLPAFSINGKTAKVEAMFTIPTIRVKTLERNKPPPISAKIAVL